MQIQKITPCLWFNGNAEEAAKFYVSVFKNSKLGAMARCGDVGPGPKGSVLTVEFTLDGHNFLGLNAGPQFPFTEAISLTVYCNTQDEIDDFWDKLTADGGKPVECGWLKDKFGLSWQIVPSIIPELLTRDAATTDRVMQVVMRTKKFDIETVRKAAG